MKRVLTFPNLLHLWLLCVIANSYVAIQAQPLLLIAIIPAYLAFQMLAGFWEPATESKRIRVCYHGAVMLFLYAASMIASVLYHVILFAVTSGDNPKLFWASLLTCLGAELAVFFNGILCIRLASFKLNRREFVTAVCLGWLPVINFWAIRKLMRSVIDEVREQEVLDADM